MREQAADSGAPRIRLELLGPPRAFVDGRPVAFRTRKTLALLAFLALEPGAQPRERLAALFWPESDNEAARTMLRRTLAFLRDALDEPEGGEALLADRSSVRLVRERVAIDLDLLALRGEPDEIAALMRAADAVRGDLLAGFTLEDAPEFDDWASVQREAWHRRAGDAFDRLTRRLLEGGRAAEAAGGAASWVAHDRLDERAHRRGMEAALALGDRAGALRLYDACRAALAAELGIDPDPETAALAERARGFARPAMAAPPAGMLETPLVGREAAFARLVECYRSLPSGARVTVLEGEAGIGKTRLARAFLAWAAGDGAETLTGRAFEVGGGLPYQPVADALRRRLAGNDAAALVGDRHRAGLARLLPELAPDRAQVMGDRAEGEARGLLFAAVAEVGSALARRAPTVVFLDDAQWADGATLDVLAYAVQRWADRGDRVLLLLTARAEALAFPDRSRPGVEGWIGALGRSVPILRVRLDRLGAEAVGELVDRLLADAAPGERAAFSAWLAEETAGQPLFLYETLRSLVDRRVLDRVPGEAGALRLTGELAPESAGGGVARGVRDVIRGRLARLDGPAWDLLAVASVLGRDVRFATWCETARILPEEALPALDALLAAGLIRETEGPGGERRYGFTHDRVRDVVYTETGEARRLLLHGRAYAALERAGGSAADRARHAFAAGMTAAGVRSAIAAGDAAMRLFAVRDAIDWYERARAAALLPDGSIFAEVVDDLPHLFTQLGRARELAGDLPAATATYHAMEQVGEQLGQPAMAATALNRRAVIEPQGAGDLVTARALLDRALKRAEASGQRATVAETWGNSALLAFYATEPRLALAHADRALDIARELDTADLSGRILSLRAMAAMVLGRWTASEHAALEARTTFARLGNRAMEADALCQIASARTQLGRPLDGSAAAREAQAISVAIENPWGLAHAGIHLGMALLEAGEHEVALAETTRAIDTARAHDLRFLIAMALTVHGAVLRALGAFPEAIAAHEEGQRMNLAIAPPPFTDALSAELCADAAAAGEWDVALAHARTTLTARKDALYTYAFMQTLPAHLEALVRGGERAMAEADLRRLEAMELEGPRYRLSLLRARAAVAAAPEERAATRGEALALATELDLPFERLACARDSPDERDELAGTLRRIASGIGNAQLRAQFLAAYGG